MNQSDTVCLLPAIGARLRVLREASGKLQSDIAKTARDYYGFNWSRATVAGIELGRRQLALEELFCLPLILNTAEIHAHEGGEERVIELAELLPADGLITISPGLRISARIFRAMVQGKFHVEALPEKDPAPELRAAHRKMQRAMLLKIFTQDSERMKAIQHVWPGAEKNFNLMAKVEREAEGEVEIKAARKSGVSPFAIALAARKLWTRSLTTERDHRVTAQITKDISPRRVQALRGHITRSLLTQIEPLVAELRSSS